MVTETQKAQHKHEGGIHEDCRATDVGSCDDLVDIVGKLVSGDEARFQDGVEEDASRSAHRR